MSDPDPTSPPSSSSSTWRERIDLLAQPPTLTPARLAAGVAALGVLLAVGWLLLRAPAAPPVDTLLPMAARDAAGVPGGASTVTTAPASVLVHAAGAVVDPGVYELAGDARVKDVIDAAGGPALDADLDRLNLAAPVRDGERIYVPRVGEVVAGSPDAGSEPSVGEPLDLNTATLEQLDALPGIGPATAEAIIAERDRRGGFRSVEELLDVRGIGPAKLDRLRDLVRV